MKLAELGKSWFHHFYPKYGHSNRQVKHTKTIELILEKNIQEKKSPKTILMLLPFFCWIIARHATILQVMERIKITKGRDYQLMKVLKKAKINPMPIPDRLITAGIIW
jgi:hypothetical protein